jgi:hypothetical protein
MTGLASKSSPKAVRLEEVATPTLILIATWLEISLISTSILLSTIQAIDAELFKLG